MSQTYLGLYATVIVSIGSMMGVDIPGTDADTTVKVIAVLITGIWTAAGRYRVGGVNPLGRRN